MRSAGRSLRSGPDDGRQTPSTPKRSPMTDPGPIPPRFQRFEGSQGLSLAADILGDDDCPTVLLAHGGGQTRHAWGGAALALALRGWRAVSIDQRGHGDSDRSPEKNYLMGHFGADLRAVAGRLDRPVAVGASLGGIAALVAEGESPEPVLGAVVLVDITPRVRPEGAARVVDFMKAHVETGFGSLEEAADAVAAYLPNRRRPRDLTGLQKNLRAGEDGRWYWHWDPAFITDARARQEDRDPERLEACARMLACRRTPTLLVRGGSSDLVTETEARAFLDLVPHARFVDVSGAGHMVAGDRNDAFNTAIIRFLRDLP